MPRVQQIELENPESASVRRNIDNSEFTERDLNRRINDMQARLIRTQQSTEELRNRLDGIQPELITLEEAKAALDNPFIHPKSIGLIDKPNGSKVLRWVFSGLMCTADENPYMYANFESTFPLMNCVVEVELRNFTVKIKPQVNKRRLCPIGYNNRRVHPHILSSDTPCFGDFGDQVVVATQERDLGVLADVIQCFLEQAYNQDAAGKSWPKFYLSKFDVCTDRMNRHEMYIGELDLHTYVYGEYTRNYQTQSGRNEYCLPIIEDQKVYMFKGDHIQLEEFIGTYFHLAVHPPGSCEPSYNQNNFEQVNSMHVPDIQWETAALTIARDPVQNETATTAAPEPIPRTGATTGDMNWTHMNTP